MNPASLRPIADHLWQSTLFAGVAGLLTLALRANRARVRYWLWLTASCKFLAPLSVLVALGTQIPWRVVPTGAESSLAIAKELGTPFTVGEISAPLSPQPAVVWPTVPVILLVVWACGFIGIAFSWWIRWRSIRQNVGSALPVTASLSMPV